MHARVNQPQTPKTAQCPSCGSTRLLYSRGKLTCTNCSETIGATFNKYGAKKTEYKGYRYDSKFEAQIAQELDLRLRTKDIAKVEKQVKIPLEAYGEHITNYYIDFVITHNDGHREYLEVKGMEQNLWKLKLKMLEAKLKLEEKDAEISVVKQNSTKKVGKRY